MGQSYVHCMQNGTMYPDYRRLSSGIRMADSASVCDGTGFRQVGEVP